MDIYKVQQYMDDFNINATVTTTDRPTRTTSAKYFIGLFYN